MSIISDIKKLSAEHLLIFGLLFIATISPGMLTIYHYKPLFNNIDIFKLIFLSLSFTVPLYYVNLFLSAITLSKSKADSDKYDIFIIAAIYSGTILGFSIFYSVILNLPIQKFIINTVIFQIAIFIMSIIIFIINKSKYNKNRN